jgi:hypothetical protein
MQFDAMLVGRQPGFAFGFEVVTRTIVDDQDDLFFVAADEALKKAEEGVAIESVGEPKVEFGVVQSNRSEDVRSLAFASSIDSRLAAYSSPSLVQGGVELETGFILKENGCALPLGFFLVQGRFCATRTPVPANRLDLAAYGDVEH